MCKFAKSISELNERKGWNYNLATCAEKIDLSAFGIQHNRCIDDELIARIAWNDTLLMKHLGLEIKPLETGYMIMLEADSGSWFLCDKYG